jgi:UDP-glucose 4-epimerase
MVILVTGGAGYIGSHTCAELLDHGYDVVVVDDYSNSSPAALDAVRKLTGRQVAEHRVDLRDRHALDRVFERHPVDAVIHFAAKKAVGESVLVPLDYYDVNVGGTTTLLRSMLDHGVRRLVFSSSCSVYGDQYSEPIAEDDLPQPTNPYARSKLICEQILADACAASSGLTVISLRYFNPAGAHPSGLLGEDPLGIPSNLMPFLTGVMIGRLHKLRIFGTDYPTADGTGVRDYIHVADLAQAHRTALDHLDDRPGIRVLNLGTGVGVSVLELVAAFTDTCGVAVPCEIVGRRPGDVASLIADVSRVRREWGWRTTRDIDDMCRDAWRFQQLMPAGYRG